MILSAKKIKKAYSFPSRVEVLTDVSLQVDKGESVAIMGKSGEGKSTLLHILGTLEKPCSGEIVICGHSLGKSPLPLIRNKHIGFIFQSSHLLDEETVLDNVLMPAKIGRVATHKKSQAYARALFLLDLVGLRGRAHFLAKLLSGGEKGRASIARALCNDPDLILADEPSGNLDHAHSQEVHALLMHLCKTEEKSLVVVTHDTELAALCDKTFTLKDGVLL